MPRFLLALTVALATLSPVLADIGDIAWLPAEIENWNAEMREAADRHGVPAALLAIMVMVESRGNPQAESAWGALGLMQVMPRTGRMIAEERGIEGFRVADLRDPETNLDFGAWYLARQLDMARERTSGDDMIAIAAAAYNGGPGSVREFLDDGVALSDETARYSEVVQRLWIDRDKPRSEAFERLWRGPAVQ
jgi:soluble lytic murein transglycosylase-like protein